MLIAGGDANTALLRRSAREPRWFHVIIVRYLRPIHHGYSRARVPEIIVYVSHCGRYSRCRREGKRLTLPAKAVCFEQQRVSPKRKVFVCATKRR